MDYMQRPRSANLKRKLSHSWDLSFPLQASPWIPKRSNPSSNGPLLQTGTEVHWICKFLLQVYYKFLHHYLSCHPAVETEYPFSVDICNTSRFWSVKDSVYLSTHLTTPRSPSPYVLEVDASENAMGAILSQRQGMKSLLHPIAFLSRKLSPAERNYDVGDGELLAIKTALEEQRFLLEGAAHPIVIFTDHKNLEYLKTAKRLRPRQARWALFFSRFSFHISFRPDSKNGKPDALLRMYPKNFTKQTQSCRPKVFCYYK